MKSGGRDTMIDSPSIVEKSQLDELGIQLQPELKLSDQA